MRIEHQEVKENPCVICDKVKMKGEVKRYRVCETKRAKQLLSAMRFFKDKVHNKCVFLETVGDIFAADIMYHSNCLSNYLLKFKREVELIMNDQQDFGENKDIGKIFQDLVKSLDLKHQAIHLSIVRDLLNEKFHAENIGIVTCSIHYCTI